MSWTTPKTWTAAVLTSTDLNTHLRDNLNLLKASVDDNGHLYFPTIQSKSGTYTALVTDDIIQCTGSWTLSLYATPSHIGRWLLVLNVGTGTITVDANGSDTIDGDLTLTLYPGAVAWLYIAAANTWRIAARRGLNYVTTTANYTATANDDVINCTSGTFTVTLPTAVGLTGKRFEIKNTGSGVITIDGNAAETIDGAATVSVPQYFSYSLVSDGANWIIV